MVEWGKYPEPTNITDVTYSWTLAAWHQGTFWESTFRNVMRLDKIAVDPVTDKEYTYSVTNNRKEYQIWGIMETQDFVMAEANQVNAWEQAAIARITWSYNWAILKVKKGKEIILLASPSIICSEGMTVEECLWQNKLAYNWYKNLPSNYKWTQYKLLWEAWSLNLVNNDYLIFEWNTADLSEDTIEWEAARKTVVEKLKAAYSDTKIASREWIRKLVNVDTTDEVAVKNLWVSIVNNKIKSGMITASKLSVDINDTSTWWWSSTWSDWRAQDSNCDLSDVVIWDQVWAGCNSTIGTWINYVPWQCYNCAWTNNWSNCGWYSSKESDYNSVWVNNIWWKLYTWDNAQNACGTWYHLPSIEEWTTAMISLGCTNTVSSTTTWWKCAWLWWKNNGTLKDKLKMPLAGYHSVDGVSFYDRGYGTYLWASSIRGYEGRWVNLRRLTDTVYRFSRVKANGFSVRCIKD